MSLGYELKDTVREEELLLAPFVPGRTDILVKVQPAWASPFEENGTG